MARICAIAPSSTTRPRWRDCEAGILLNEHVAEDGPTVFALAAAIPGRRCAFLVTAVFTGLRSSELRGLRWIDIDLVKGEVHVRQRADRYNAIGPPKSASSVRTIPIG